MKPKDSSEHSTREERKQLNSIISDYASIWADVLYCKDLEKHLKGIEFDILMIDIAIEFYSKKNTDQLLAIKNDIIKLKNIVKTKINN